MGATDHRKTNILLKKICFIKKNDFSVLKNRVSTFLKQKKMAGNPQILPQGEEIRSDNLSPLFGKPPLMVENGIILWRGMHVYLPEPGNRTRTNLSTCS